MEREKVDVRVKNEYITSGSLITDEFLEKLSKMQKYGSKC